MVCELRKIKNKKTSIILWQLLYNYFTLLTIVVVGRACTYISRGSLAESHRLDNSALQKKSSVHIRQKKAFTMSENGSGGPTAAAADDNKGPSGFLTEIIGAPITVKLNSGVEYRGLHNDISPTVFGEASLTDVFSLFFFK